MSTQAQKISKNSTTSKQDSAKLQQLLLLVIMDSLDTFKRIKSASPSMNPISPTTLDNLSMDLKEKKYHEGLNFDDEISNPSPSIGPKTPKSSKQRYSSFSSPSVGAFTDIYSQAPKAQRSPKKSILSPTKNYSELVNRLRAARGSPVKTENKVTDSGKYKWSPTSRINSLEEEMSKLHRDAEKNEIYRKENLRLQKEMEKLESVKLDCAQAQKDASYWKTEIEYLKQESSRLKEESSRLKEENTRLQTTLDSKDSKLDHLQIENEKLTKHKTMQASIIAKRDTKIAELRKSLNLSIAYSDKWCEMIDSMAVEIRKLKQHIRDLKEKKQEKSSTIFEAILMVNLQIHEHPWGKLDPGEMKVCHRQVVNQNWIVEPLTLKGYENSLKKLSQKSYQV